MLLDEQRRLIAPLFCNRPVTGRLIWVILLMNRAGAIGVGFWSAKFWKQIPLKVAEI